jgi:purine-binding chemotaxis protein CheW
MQHKNEHNSSQISAQNDEHLESSDTKYLVFKLADELYGVPLSQVKEVIKARDIKPIPYMVNYFQGIINLHGKIVSVIDLRVKFELKIKTPGEGLLLIIETQTCIIGTIIDDIVSVNDFYPEDIEQNANLESRIPLNFFLGIAKSETRLISIINIAGCLTSEDLKNIDTNQNRSGEFEKDIKEKIA